MIDVFYESSYKLCKSIISQRLILLKLDKSKISDIDNIRMITEELNNEFDKYRSSPLALAYFIKKYYEKLILIIVRSNGFERKIDNLTKLYKQSLEIV